MTKQFGEWLDEFVEKGADPNNIVDWPEEASGKKVVSELPEVGQENTVYELRKPIDAAYNWVAASTMKMDREVGAALRLILIFDTYNQMIEVFNDLDAAASMVGWCLCYLRNEDKLYTCHIEFEEVKWIVEECEKISPYLFKPFSYEFGGYLFLCVLQSYEGYDEEDDKYYGILYDGSKIELSRGAEDSIYGFILCQADRQDILYNMYPFSTNDYYIYPVTQLPTAQEVMEKYNGAENWGSVEVEINGRIKNDATWGETYRWDKNIRNFVKITEEPTPEPIIYTGELEWVDEDGIPIYDEIHYRDIFENGDDWIFKPDPGTTDSSYWIYKDGQWMNLDDVTVLHLQDKWVVPQKDFQMIEADSRYNGLRIVSVEGVSAAVDDNIVAENIKKGVEILGVRGTYDNNGAQYEITEIATQMPIKLYRQTVFAYGDYIYIVGDNEASFSINTSTFIYKFNTKTETIAALQVTIPTEMKSSIQRSFGQINNNVYLFCGSGRIIKFDAITETIEVLEAKLSKGVFYTAVGCYGDNIYLVDGRNEGKGSPVNLLCVFNTKTETVSESTLYLSRYNSGYAQIGCDLYMVCGNVGGPIAYPSNDIVKYNVETRTSKLLSITLPRYYKGMTACEIGGNIYLFGGISRMTPTGTDTNWSIVWRFNPEDENVEEVFSLPYASTNISLARIGNTIYLFNLRDTAIYKFKVKF